VTPRKSSSLARTSLFVLTALASACSSKSTDEPPTFVARFDLPSSGVPEVLQVPFPSDLWRAADGTIALPKGVEHILPGDKGVKFIVEAYARTRGWGVYSGAFFALDSSIKEGPDVSKLPKGDANDCTSKDSPVFVFDVDAGVALECRAAYSNDEPFGEDSTTPVLSVSTARGVVHRENHRIAVLLTSGVVSKSGVPLSASAKFASVRDGARTTDAERLYGSAIDAAAAKIGFDKSRVVSAAVYTTGKLGDDLRHAREVGRATPVPALKWSKDDVAPVTNARFTATDPLPAEWTASLDALFGKPNKLPSGDDDPDWGSTNPGVAHDAIGSIAVATFDAPAFLIDAGDYIDANHGTLYRDASGQVAINPKKPTLKVWVTFVVPKAPAPPEGYPVVVFQHGLGGQRADAFQIANSLAHKGWATAAIEPLLQGTRGLDANARGDTKNDFNRPTSTYAGPDGFSDRSKDGSNVSPTDLFGGLFRVASMRDQLRQSVLDHTTLVRLLRSSPSLDGLAQGGVTPKLDGRKVAYMGDSLGGILGALTSGIEPEHRAYILNVPGAAILTEMAPNAPELSGLLTGAAALFFGLGRAQVSPHHPLAIMMQHVLDGGDPIHVARTAFLEPDPKTPRNVVVFEALHDEIMSNQATEALARAMGARLIAPHGPTLATFTDADGASGVHDVPTAGATGVLVHLSPAQHGWDLFTKRGKRNYSAVPPVFDDPTHEVFAKLEKTIEFDNPYLEAQALALQFIDDAFAGKVPTVKWTKVPAPVTD